MKNERIEGTDMCDFKDIVQINKNFQKSINMRLDYNKPDKIESYIPTRASVQILKIYLNQFVNEGGLKSTILIGPYGKGKSHLLLVLLALLSKKNQTSDNLKAKKMLQVAVEKIRQKDEEAGDYAATIVKEQRCYLPILISGAQNDFRRALLLSLKEALVQEGLENIVPNTYFEEAKKIVFQWKDNYPDTYNGFLEHLKKEKKSEMSFLKELDRYEESALRFFQKIYPLLTAGSVFEPMVQMDEISLFRSVNEKLCRDYGYGGIILIFDEFSKFVEGYPKEYFASAMEQLQNLCELANNSKKEKLHVILVAHKAIKEYKNSLPDEVINAYMGVEGRLSEVYFTTSLKNSYELIENVIVKNEKIFEKEVTNTQKFKEMEKSSYQLPYFHSLFTEQEFQTIVGKGCFPLTPVAAYLLLKISEKAVQNERTVFTFLTNEEPYSMLHFLEEQKNFHGNYVTAGEVYDYFSNMLKNDSSNVTMHNEWLKAEYALQENISPEERTVIKTIALIRMVGKQDEMYAKDEVIRLGAGMDSEVYAKTIEQLKQKQVVLFRSKLGSYAFKNNIGVDLEKEIERTIQTKLQKINLCEELTRVSELEYEIPKRYNLTYTMTRYFHYQFISEDNFMNLKNTKYLFEDKFADGKIIALVREKPGFKENVLKHLNELKDARIVVVYPEELFKQTDLLKKIIAIRMLKNSEEFLENNKALEQELNLYEEDLVFELNVWLEQYFLPLRGNCHVLYGSKIYENSEFAQQKSDSKFNQFLSGILEKYYCCTPKINNEMINKHILSAQMNKVRRKLMEQILEKQDFWEYRKGTSPEATIFRAVFLKTGVIKLQNGEDVIQYNLDTGVARILKEMDEFFRKAAGEKQNFGVLYQKLMGEKFGVRKGVLPLYLAYCLTRFEEMPVIYLGEKEVTVEPQILENINASPEQYFLYMEKESLEKELYLGALERIFAIESPQNERNRLQVISDGIYQWFCSLPQCAKNYSLEELPEKKKQGIRFLRKGFSKLERNPREILLEKLPQAFGEVDYKELKEQIQQVKNEMDSYIWNIKQQAVKVTKQVFGFAVENDLLQELKEYQKELSRGVKNSISSRKISKFWNGIQQLNTHNENEIVEKISKILLDLYIEDWKENGLQQYEESLKLIKTEMESVEERAEEGTQTLIFTNSQGIEIKKYYRAVEVEGTSRFFQNELEDTLEDYADSLETNQKIAVMLQMIEKLLEG